MIKWYTEYTDTFIFPICPLNASTLHSQKGFGAPVYIIYPRPRQLGLGILSRVGKAFLPTRLGKCYRIPSRAKQAVTKSRFPLVFSLCRFSLFLVGLEERNVYLFENLINPRYFVWYRFLAQNNSQKLKKTLLPPVPEVISLRMKRTGKRETSR